MGDGPITFADGVFLSILLLSGVFALIRGFTREILTLAAWLIPVVIMWFLYEPVHKWARDVILDGVIMDVVVASLLFLVPLVGLSLASHYTCVKVREAGIVPADRILGFVFGIARGLAAAVILYWMYNLVEDPSDHPRWMSRAKFFPIVANSAEHLGDWLHVAVIPGLPRYAKLILRAPEDGDTMGKTDYVKAYRVAIERPVLPPASTQGRI